MPPEDSSADASGAEPYPDVLSAAVPYTHDLPDMREAVDLQEPYRRDVLQGVKAGLGAAAVSPGLTGCADTNDDDHTTVADLEDEPGYNQDSDAEHNGFGRASSAFDSAAFADDYPDVFAAEAATAHAEAQDEMVTFNRYLRANEGYDQSVVGPDSVFLQFAYDARADAIAPRYAGRAGVTALDGFKDLTVYDEGDDLFTEDLLPAFVGLMYPTVRHLREYEIMRRKPNQEAITQIDYLVQGGANGVAVVDLTRQSFAKAANIVERSNTVQKTREQLYDMARERVEIRGD